MQEYFANKTSQNWVMHLSKAQNNQNSFFIVQRVVSRLFSCCSTTALAQVCVRGNVA